jgi:hypothetical protein
VPDGQSVIRLLAPYIIHTAAAAAAAGLPQQPDLSRYSIYRHRKNCCHEKIFYDLTFDENIKHSFGLHGKSKTSQGNLHYAANGYSLLEDTVAVMTVQQQTHW